jgi:signal transduction histidine kinase
MSASGVEGFSVIVTDLTERRQSENALRKISEELLQKNVELGAFSHSISHDMRAPLRSMQGFAKILLEDYGDKLEAKPKSYLEKIVASAARLSQLIQDVLAYSQLSQGQKVTGTFDLDKLVRAMVESYPNLREAGIEIVVASTPVRGYEVALSQCLSNLLCNAIKFVPTGVVPRVKVWTEQNNGQLRLWVEDNGIGIALKDQKRIFDVFARVHGNEIFEGTGLGLSMVKSAVEKMGGTFGVESELGKGSRFWIELQTA